MAGNGLAPRGEPLGEHGGVVLRGMKLSGEDVVPGDEVPAEVLLGIPLINRLALRNTEMIRYFDKSGKNGTDRVAELEVVIAEMALDLQKGAEDNRALQESINTLAADVGRLKASATRRVTAKKPAARRRTTRKPAARRGSAKK